MDTDEPLALLPLVERSNVRKADDGRAPRPLRLQPLQQPHRSVPTTGAEDRSYSRICDRRVQLGKPPLIVTRQVPESAKNSGVVLHAVATGNNGESRIE
jgi:hypothetical protein